MIFAVFEDVDAETDDDSSIATTQDSKEDTLTESSDMAEDTTLIKSTEISIVEDMCVKEEIMTGKLSFNKFLGVQYLSACCWVGWQHAFSNVHLDSGLYDYIG